MAEGEWLEDPAGQFELRFWDGAAWTEHVSTGGVQERSPLPVEFLPAVEDDDDDPEPEGPVTYTGQVLKGYNGSVSFDGQFVTITRKGGLARMSIGKGEKRIPLPSITAVQWKPPGPMVNGYIQFTVPGGNEKRARFGRQTADAARDENSVIVTRKRRKEFLALREAVELALAKHHSSAEVPVRSTTTSTADELRKLGELLEAGLLTREEFDAQKAKLLA